MRRSIPAWAGNPAQRGPASRTNKVYPRVGGEPALALAITFSACGLSPRGRGTRAASTRCYIHVRSIPAWAGNPGHAQLASLKVSVYPRVGGEPKDNDGNLAQNQGLSPRGRGTRWERTREVVSSGSIPAWAGNPEWRRKCTREGAVYPRVGGEPILRRAERRGRKGLSPRGRGTRLLQPVGGAQGRSIPAWAGNPHGPGRLRTQHPVYPRVGGEPLCTLPSLSK